MCALISNSFAIEFENNRQLHNRSPRFQLCAPVRLLQLKNHSMQQLCWNEINWKLLPSLHPWEVELISCLNIIVSEVIRLGGLIVRKNRLRNRKSGKKWKLNIWSSGLVLPESLSMQSRKIKFSVWSLRYKLLFWIFSSLGSVVPRIELDSENSWERLQRQRRQRTQRF